MIHSAPGKLMLVGEHAVVYGYPSIVTAVDERIAVDVAKTDSNSITIYAPGAKNTSFVEESIQFGCRFFNTTPDGFHVSIEKAFSSQFGFGSSSAVTVATLASLAHCLGMPITERDLFSIAFDVVKHVQGVASGFDVAAASYGKTIWYEGLGKNIEYLPFDLTDASFIIGYSGIKADTVPLVRMVRERYEKDRRTTKIIFEDIEKLVIQAKAHIMHKEWEALGSVFVDNHTLLKKLDVSTPVLDRLVQSACTAGAYGAKLSGAGGGDCIIVLAPNSKKNAVEEAIIAAGGSVLDVSINAKKVSPQTTDNQQELFVCVDENDEIIGYKTRGECHRNPQLIHRAVDVVLFDNTGKILLQKRSKSKDTYPGYWTISASGHVGKNESYEEAAHRELLEETCIQTELEFVAKTLYRFSDESEYSALYKGIVQQIESVHTSEVDELCFFSHSELKEHMDSGTIKLTPAAINILSSLHYL